jgi:S-DNA-T family DNA segregation ATPase FtsK/SpoIIIE
VADQVANDGLLGSGKYAAGIRATELRINTDRGTCVAVGITDEAWELVRTFYVPFEDGTDDVTPVIARAVALIEETGWAIESSTRPELEAAPVADHLADIDAVMGGERRVRTQVILTRLARHDPGEYEGWTFRDLTAVLSAHGIAPAKSDGNKVVRAEDVAAALANRDRDRREPVRDPAGSQGVVPDESLNQNPCVDQGKPDSGTSGARRRPTPESGWKPDFAGDMPGSLPHDQDDGHRGRDG